MTEQELIEIAKNDFFELEKVDKSLITKNVIDNLRITQYPVYTRVLRGVNPDNISKEKALRLLKYDPELYGLLSEKAQTDTDILHVITEYPDKLPKALFKNKEGVKYLLNRYNVDGKSWATFGVRGNYFIFKPNVNERMYYVYVDGYYESSSKFALYGNPEIDNDDPCIESRNIAIALKNVTLTLILDFTKHID